MTDSHPGGAPEPSPSVTVRPAVTDGELDAAGHVVLAAYEADGLEIPSYRATLLAARERAQDAEVAVAVDGAGHVVGSVTLALPGSRWASLACAGEAEFRMLGVLPAARGRGVGTALVRWCLDRARALGRRRVIVSSARPMRRAHQLYVGCGFSRAPELDWSPFPGVELAVYRIDL